MQNEKAPSRFDAARVKPNVRTGMRNGGWAFDTYPEMPRLLAGAEMEVGYVEGPGVITQLHTTAHCWLHADPVKRAEIARGLVLLIYYNDSPEPAVQVPMADFFADGCGGRAVDFSSACVEKGPETYNATFLMPFEHSVRVVVRNDTATDIDNYFFFEYELLPEWDPGLGYFHATWKRFALQATTKTVAPIIQLKGPGHILGHHWSISTDEGMFYDMNWIMEANNEIRIDGGGPEPPGPYKPNQGPAYDYLGTEDSFDFSWGFRRVFCGIWNGMNFIETKTPYQVSLYRFRGSNLLRF
jgi:hypothetical protein